MAKISIDTVTDANTARSTPDSIDYFAKPDNPKPSFSKQCVVLVGYCFMIGLTCISIVFVMNISAKTMETQSWPNGFFFVQSLFLDIMIYQIIMSLIYALLFMCYWSSKKSQLKNGKLRDQKFSHILGWILNGDLIWLTNLTDLNEHPELKRISY